MSIAAAPHDPRQAFEQELNALRQRLWLERVGVVITRSLMIGFVLTLAVAIGGWYLRIPIQPLWYAFPLLLPVALGAIVCAFLYPSAITAALIVDKRLELSEQIATAEEVIAEEVDDPVAWAQVGAATTSAAWAQQHWKGGPRLGRDLAITAILGFLAAGALLLTGPEGRFLFPNRQTTTIPVASDQPQAIASPSPAAVQKPQAQPSPQAQPQGRTAGVQRAVSDIKRSRENGTLDSGEAGRRLGQAETELSRQTQQSRTDQQGLGRLGEALDQIAAGHEAAESIKRGDYEQAARQIQELGTESDQLSQDAKNQLAQALRQAANESPSSPELGQAERRAADALMGRDYEAARQAFSDLGDQVNTRARNVIPQGELARAWDQVNQERRAQGQPDSPGSAQRPDPSQNRQQGQGQRGQQQGQQGQQGQGQSPQPQDGNGIGTAPSQGGPPGEQQADAPAPRLDTQGQQVEVELKPGEKPGTRPGDADKEDDKPRDETGSITAASAADPGQVTSAAPPEINFVPSGRRDIVREYFRGPGENRAPAPAASPAPAGR